MLASDAIPVKSAVACIACGSTTSGTSTERKVLVPRFGDVHIAAFSCEACEYSYNRVYPQTHATFNGIRPGEDARAASHPCEGQRITLRCTAPEDLRREVVVSDFCSVRIKEVDCYLRASEGRLTTVEGLAQYLGIAFARLILVNDSDGGGGSSGNLQERVAQLIADVEHSRSEMTLVLEDTSGQSFVAPLPGTANADSRMRDPRLTTETFVLTDAQKEELGVASVERRGVATETKTETETESATAEATTTTCTTKATAKEMMSFLNAMAGASEYAEQDGY